MVKSKAVPLDLENDFQLIKKVAQIGIYKKVAETGKTIDIRPEARDSYSQKVLSFFDVEAFKQIRVLVNMYGAAGPTFDILQQKCKALGSKVDFQHLLQTRSKISWHSKTTTF